LVMDVGSWGGEKLEMVGSLRNGSATTNGDWAFPKWKEILFLVSVSVEESLLPFIAILFYQNELKQDNLNPIYGSCDKIT
jgi:hypothetical protein